MKHRSLVAAGGAAVTIFSAACISTTDVAPPRPFAYIDIRELPVSNATGLAPYASAVFLKDRVSGVVPSYALNEGCNLAAPIATDDGSGVPLSGSNLEPGNVTMVVHGTKDSTVALAAGGITNGLLTYTNSDAPPLVGGSDSIRVAGTGQAGGFPAFEIRTSSVPRFVPQPVDDSIVGQGIRAQWTPLPATSPTRMQISLQYATAKNAAPTMEVRCIAVDDGDFTIPRQYLTEWQEAGVNNDSLEHQVVFSRFNTVGANIADGVAVIVTRTDTTLVSQH
ncbi:MAG: hypothetical protein ACJ79K_18150 [Gemmatimonadaceae bacterium]